MRPAPPPSLAARSYAWLLVLYPAPFRRRWGGEMVALAETLLARERERGGRAAARLWLHLLADLVAGAAAERRHAARYRRPDARQPRSARSLIMIQGLARDLVEAIRSLRRYPAHSLAVALTLGLGIGVTTAIYSVVRGVLLEPLPYREPGRLVLLFESNPERGWMQAEVAPANFFDWQQRTRAFSGMAGFSDYLGQSIATGGGRPERVRMMAVVGDLFGVLGAPPALGRSFRPAETWMSEERVAVLSYGYWQKSLGGAADVIGRRLQLNEKPYTVVGVMPRGFSLWSEEVDIWTPYAWDPADRTAVFFRRAHMFRGVARLKPDVTLAAANAELRAVAAQLEKEYPETNTAMGAGASPLGDWLLGPARRPSALLFAAALLVLLIATANVAHLQLARATRLARDAAVRSCLVASRWRLLRRTLVESLTLSVVGAAAGVAIAWWLTPALVELGSAFLPRPSAAVVDVSALTFAAALGVLTALLSGLGAAQRGSRPDLETAVRESQRAGEGRASAYTRRRLVAAEVALAVIVVVAAVLLVRTLIALDGIDPGFDPRGVTTAAVALPSVSYPDDAAIGSFVQRYLGRVQALPGVEEAGLVRTPPVTAPAWSSDVSVEGSSQHEYGVEVIHREATAGYFTALRVPLLAGRHFRAGDDMKAPPVVIINQVLAEQLFAGESPIGRRICFDRPPTPDSFWRTVVGVVGAERQDNLAQPPRPEIFAPLVQDPTRRLALVVRSSLPEATLVPSLRTALAGIDPQLPLFDVRSMETVVAISLGRERFLLVLFALFAGLALLLAALGVYGVTADGMARRRREIAVRLAIGARPPVVVRSAVREEMAAVGVGLAAGLLGALGLGRAMRGLLYGVAATDPLTLVAAPALLLVVAMLAAWLPARRTAGIAPAEVLRE